MKVLMFGWEFPPKNTGGLGTACYGLTKNLSEQADITLVLPKYNGNHSFLNKVISGDVKINVKKRKISSLLVPYLTKESYDKKYQQHISKNKNQNEDYGENLFEEVKRFAKNSSNIALTEEFDVIHAHDWMTFEAGIIAKKRSGKPLVVHVHATEYDRTGGNGVNPYVYNLEKKGMKKADKVITVSNFTKNKVIENYGINPEKIKVVHNGVELETYNGNIPSIGNKKIVLFLGRLSLQKGPDYFIEAAKKISEKKDNVLFVVTGKGDMKHDMIKKAADLGIGDKVLFTGFVDDVRKVYSMADVYVMPSVSEPFGLTPLESLTNGTPVIISKQSGVSEVLNHCLKVDFWDIDNLTNKVLSVLRYKELHSCLKRNGKKDIEKITWKKASKKCMEVYKEIMR